MKAKKTLGILLSVCMMALLFSGCTTAAATGGDQTAANTMNFYSIGMLVVMGLFLYFFMIRPEQKKKKKAEEMRSSIEPGDKITTIGGMVGRVVHVTSDRITFETGEDRVRIEVTKWAVSSNDGKGSKEKVSSEEVINN